MTINVLCVSQRYASSLRWKEHTPGKKTTLISNSLWKTLREIDLGDSPRSVGSPPFQVAVTLIPHCPQQGMEKRGGGDLSF